MVFTPLLPHNTVQSMGWAEEIIRGNPCGLNLPFHWSHMELNLPGSVSYDPLQLAAVGVETYNE
jgi:hypothetical protein